MPGRRQLPHNPIQSEGKRKYFFSPPETPQGAKEGVRQMYITLGDLLDYSMVLIALATFIWMAANHINKKK